MSLSFHHIQLGFYLLEYLWLKIALFQISIARQSVSFLAH